MRSAGCLVAVCLILAAPFPAMAEEEAWRQRLADDFELGDFAPEGGLYYKNNFEQSAGTVEFQSGDVRDGNGALTLSLRPNCSADHDGCSERAEVWERPEVLAPYDKPLWYGFSMKLVEPIPDDAHRYLLAQWKRQLTPEAGKDYSPFLAIRLDRGRLTVTVDSDSLRVFPLGSGERKTGCLPGETPVADRPHDGQTRALIAYEEGMPITEWRYVDGCTSDISVVQHAPGLPQAASGWIDLAFFIQTGPKGGGRIDVMANGRLIASATGRIGHAGDGLGEKQYFKFGPYRAAHSTDWTVLYDRFRRGPRCEDVVSEKACSLLDVAQQR